jgi:hypothetical protein
VKVFVFSHFIYLFTRVSSIKENMQSGLVNIAYHPHLGGCAVLFLLPQLGCYGWSICFIPLSVEGKELGFVFPASHVSNPTPIFLLKASSPLPIHR